MSGKLGVSQEAILEELKNTKIDPAHLEAAAALPMQAVKKSFSSEGRKKLIEDKIISLVLKNPENLSLIEDAHHCLFCNETRSFIESYQEYRAKERK